LVLGETDTMNITDVRIKLVENAAERLLAFCAITIDGCFVVRDLKIIGGPTGLFVAMPSRKLTSHCHSCWFKNPLRAVYCSQCGKKLLDSELPRADDGRLRLYADIAHPINAQSRDCIQRRVVQEYESEVLRSHQPGYASRYDCIGDEEHRTVQ